MLGSSLAAAAVRGIQSKGVMANEACSTIRNKTHENLGRGAAHFELYYPPFESAIKAGVASIMCSYNQLNATYSCENLRTDLRERLGVSDWGGRIQPQSLPTRLLTLRCPAAFTTSRSLSLIQRGVSNARHHGPPRAHSDVPIWHVRPRFPPREGKPANVTSDKHRTTAKDLAISATTLLKNANNLLPLTLKKGLHVAVSGGRTRSRHRSL